MPLSNQNHAKPTFNQSLYNLYPSEKSSAGSSSSGGGDY